MIKKLRIKFVIVNMIFAVSILAGVLLIFFFSNATRFQRDSYMTMNMAMEDKKVHRLQERLERDDIAKDMPTPPMPFFVVVLDQEFMVKEVQKFSLSISEEYANTISDIALSQNRKDGVLPDYSLRYLIEKDVTSTRIVFLDQSYELNSQKNMLIGCLLIFFVGSLSFLVLSLFLSEWALRPVKRAWEQQNQFIADASHELKTPLTVIIANLQILSAHKGESIKSQERWLLNTQEEAGRMKQLVEELLFLARSDTDTVPEVHSEFDFSDAVWNCILPFESVAFEQKVTMDSQIEPDIHFVGNENQIKQLTVILLDNACKYAGQNGKIGIEVSRTAGHIHMSVRNTGEPIPEEECIHIFERFYRADKSRVRKEGGYGLGLSIAHTIIMKHGGKVAVTSTAEEGTTFLVRLPLQRQGK